MVDHNGFSPRILRDIDNGAVIASCTLDSSCWTIQNGAKIKLPHLQLSISIRPENATALSSSVSQQSLDCLAPSQNPVETSSISDLTSVYPAIPATSRLLCPAPSNKTSTEKQPRRSILKPATPSDTGQGLFILKAGLLGADPPKVIDDGEVLAGKKRKRGNAVRWTSPITQFKRFRPNPYEGDESEDVSMSELDGEDSGMDENVEEATGESTCTTTTVSNVPEPTVGQEDFGVIRDNSTTPHHSSPPTLPILPHGSSPPAVLPILPRHDISSRSYRRAIFNDLRHIMKALDVDMKAIAAKEGLVKGATTFNTSSPTPPPEASPSPIPYIDIHPSSSSSEVDDVERELEVATTFNTSSPILPLSEPPPSPPYIDIQPPSFNTEVDDAERELGADATFPSSTPTSPSLPSFDFDFRPSSPGTEVDDTDRELEAVCESIEDLTIPEKEGSSHFSIDNEPLGEPIEPMFERTEQKIITEESNENWGRLWSELFGDPEGTESDDEETGYEDEAPTLTWTRTIPQRNPMAILPAGNRNIPHDTGFRTSSSASTSKLKTAQGRPTREWRNAPFRSATGVKQTKKRIIDRKQAAVSKPVHPVHQEDKTKKALLTLQEAARGILEHLNGYGSKGQGQTLRILLNETRGDCEIVRPDLLEQSDLPAAMTAVIQHSLLHIPERERSDCKAIARQALEEIGKRIRGIKH
ncbi:hypothetical protein JAAARDRAFT_28571 [Jaapia argillacea MUCL 33604]|uniref:Uncharacterized protein n=1 Tax=Jaapia argillacea MUCL 33604 TaxID=933084 RepID=A0A067QN18_9AGAM|nr:hypothetical protein JAAARDRAFT_28571 [Jaapia argillacea MUCL 33604]